MARTVTPDLERRIKPSGWRAKDPAALSPDTLAIYITDTRTEVTRVRKQLAELYAAIKKVRRQEIGRERERHLEKLCETRESRLRRAMYTLGICVNYRRG